MKRLDEMLTSLKTENRYGWIIQFFKFGLVGISNTVISLAIYYICFFGLHFHYQLANIIGFFVSVINAYYWNSRYVFAKDAKRGFAEESKRFVKTAASYGGTYFLSVVFLWIWVEKLGIREFFAPLMNLLITVPLNFVISKYWTFQTKTEHTIKIENSKSE